MANHKMLCCCNDSRAGPVVVILVYHQMIHENYCCCNEDGTDTSRFDVFDYAELCWKLGNQKAQEELGWKDYQVTRYLSIKSKLHSLAWDMARTGLPRKSDFGNSGDNGLGNSNLPIGNWSESHFRALLSHIGLNGQRDNAVMRALKKRLNAYAVGK